jgi:hypothetical protein
MISHALSAMPWAANAPRTSKTPASSHGLKGKFAAQPRPKRKLF